MELSFLLINFSHAQYWPSDAALVEAVEAAFIKKDNLIKLLYAFYPPTGLQPNHVLLRIDNITVQNFTNDTNTVPNPPFTWDYDKFRYNDLCYYDLHVLEEDPKLKTFISSPGFSSFMALFDKLSYKLYAILTFNEDYNNIVTTLSIESLETMPSDIDFMEAMDLVVSWVSLFV